MNTLKVIVIGHGIWYPKNGLCQVPDNMWMVYYSSLGKVVPNTLIDEVLKSRFSRQRPGRRCESIIDPREKTPNISVKSLGFKELMELDRLHGFETLGARRGFELITPMPGPDGQPTSYTLTEIFEMLSSQLNAMPGAKGTEVEIHWACCRGVFLKEAGGKDLGVNSGILSLGKLVVRPQDYSHWQVDEEKEVKIAQHDVTGELSWVAEKRQAFIDSLGEEMSPQGIASDSDSGSNSPLLAVSRATPGVSRSSSASSIYSLKVPSGIPIEAE